jgi:hypothetical protein
MKLCGNCIKAISFSTEERGYVCENCGNKRFSQTSVLPRLCDVCAVGKKKCQMCLDSIGSNNNNARDILDDKFKKNEFFSKIKGVTMEPYRQERVAKLTAGQELFFMHETDNQYDKNAIKLFTDKERTIDLGYVGKEITPDLLDYMYNHGVRFSIFVSEVTGGGEKNGVIKNWGCNIRVKLHR